ncbi:hypothetical protein LZ153_07060, partial [Streptococcus agalactiae]|nr:hypothetical protein [Streptococcus agalactiae]
SRENEVGRIVSTLAESVFVVIITTPICTSSSSCYRYFGHCGVKALYENVKDVRNFVEPFHEQILLIKIIF